MSLYNLIYPVCLKVISRSVGEICCESKGYSAINVGGLATGITVAMFIGLWIHDELSFNKYHAKHGRIAIVRHGGIDPQSGEYFGGPAMQFPVGATLKSNYSHLFEL